MQKYILNIEELKFSGFPGGWPDGVKEKYEGSAIGQIGQVLGSKKLGANVTKVSPGKRAFPFHSHRVNEEIFFVLEGEGDVRIGEKTFPIKKGDFIFCPSGGREAAHQIINTSKSELSYLALSTKEGPEIAEYPDSGKFGVMTEGFRFLGRQNESLDYWDGE